MSDIKNVCGLWIKPSKKDPNKKYMSGLDIKAIQALDPDKWRLMIFKNERKRNDKDPDYQVVAMPNDPKFQKKPAAPMPQRQQPQPPRNYAPPTTQTYKDDPGPGEDDLPF